MSSMGKEFLILKAQGSFCNTLALSENQLQNTIEVVSRTVKYTNPAMMGYMFNTTLSEFIKSIPQDKYMEIMEAVGERLGVVIRVAKAEQEDQAEEMAALLENYKQSKENLYKENEILNNELYKIEKELDNAEERAILAERMYNSLLDKLLQRSEGM